MRCELREDSAVAPGLTLFSTGRTCMKPTGVYLPPRHFDAQTALNIVIWLHGYYVKDIKYLLQSDETRVRQQIIDSNKDVVLIAPFLDRLCQKCSVQPQSKI